MKKIYQAPTLMVVTLQVRSHLMDVSGGGTASINNARVTDDDGFTKEYNSSSDNSVWDNEW
ncbi:MAG: hypothetical protein J6W52_03395 [Bacteroidaceae bacterium]|nr:hypothetical protein [Bacteroidaceae bacterium]